MDYGPNILEEFAKLYAYDLTVSVFGQEAELYAQDFTVSQQLVDRYNLTISPYADLIKDKHCLDIGAGTGMWAVLLLMAGAKSVTCIEPKRFMAYGINVFAQKHKLNLVCHCATHLDLLERDEVYDTVFVIDAGCNLYNFAPHYIGQLRNLTNHLIIVEKHIKLQDGHLQVERHRSVDHRSGLGFGPWETVFDSNQDSISNYDDSLQGRYLIMRMTREYYKHVFWELNYQALAFNENTMPMLAADEGMWSYAVETVQLEPNRLTFLEKYRTLYKQ